MSYLRLRNYLVNLFKLCDSDMDKWMESVRELELNDVSLFSCVRFEYYRDNGKSHIEFHIPDLVVEWLKKYLTPEKLSSIIV